MDPRSAACAVDAADAVDRAEHEAAIADRELIAIERARGRPGRAVAFDVELAAVAGTAKASCEGRDDLHLADVRPLELFSLHEDRPVRLRRAADVCAAAGHDREARRVPDEAVVPHECGPARDLARLRIRQESRDDEP